MKYYKRQIATYIAVSITLITLMIIRSEATRINIIWLEWVSHFLWGIAFISFGIWMIYIDCQERKEKAATGEPLVLKEGAGFLRRIDSTLGASLVIGGTLWVLLITYSLLKTSGLLNE